MSLSPIDLVRDPGGVDGRYVLGIICEVTERKRAYDRLAESERRYASVLSNAHAYVYRCRNEPGYPNEFASDYALELEGPLVVGIDETLERRRRKDHCKGSLPRPTTLNPRALRNKTSGLRWICAVLLAEVTWASRVWALPFLSALAHSERYAKE
jgi:hypothetical protein